ncbi:transcriptional regulator family: GATA type zinc finger [Penicillium psychrosexuale]|uniref:transcriptional regulator family: GATA type zinc finger n=1 Tax=Penicillium psychrosexuale TaxID=1002107 RepID=UPI002544FA3B|nr:transcriptional regulator family: GATA type zinc finger [Penicillium psychrosexuale]KAJ5781776.1 transcriptional regulator family: GATA type zinc finger [Penicillium psychrosexuale]
MALSRPQPYEGMPLPNYQMRSGSNEGHPGYTMEQQHVHASYGGLYGVQGAHHGGYQGVQNDGGWTERVLDEMKDLLLLLTPHGQITYASPSCKSITGRVAKQLEGSALAHYIHQDDQPIFQRDLDESVVANQSFRTHLRFHKTNGTYCLMEAYGHPHLANQDERVGRPTPANGRCTGFFLVCRPYPSKVSQLLDSFLEHKIENARLVQQIAKLKQEEDEGATATRVPYSRSDQDIRAPVAENRFQRFAHSGEISSDPDTTDTVGPNSDESDTSQSTGYFAEPNTREVYSHIDGIEVMTGLNYADGERSHGLSTGVNRGRLIHCDIDITTAADQERNAQEGDRRKRLKAQHVCSDCGTADSPEWRKGPNGPKTLCNACGLRWSKKEKKRQESA